MKRKSPRLRFYGVGEINTSQKIDSDLNKWGKSIEDKMPKSMVNDIIDMEQFNRVEKCDLQEKIIPTTIFENIEIRYPESEEIDYLFDLIEQNKSGIVQSKAALKKLLSEKDCLIQVAAHPDKTIVGYVVAKVIKGKKNAGEICDIWVSESHYPEKDLAKPKGRFRFIYNVFSKNKNTCGDIAYLLIEQCGGWFGLFNVGPVWLTKPVCKKPFMFKTLLHRAENPGEFAEAMKS